MNSDQKSKDYKKRRAETNKRWYAKHGAEYQARQRAKWKLRTEEQKIARRLKHQEWQSKNPAKVRVSNLKRTKGLRKRFLVLSRDGFCCHYCGRGAPDVVLHVDHIFPRSKGGNDALENLLTACADCNLGKGDIILINK